MPKFSFDEWPLESQVNFSMQNCLLLKVHKSLSAGLDHLIQYLASHSGQSDGSRKVMKSEVLWTWKFY